LTPRNVDVSRDVITPNGAFVLKILTCLLLAAILTGCLPIGIRGTSLPYANIPRPPDTVAQGSIASLERASVAHR
jgi:hypothetical protein